LPGAQPEKIRNNPEFRAQLEAIQPDAIVVVAYGRIIPLWMLALPRLGCINLHGSLLPKYRGAAPIQWAVAMGDAFTGNTTMLLEEGLDTGPILLQQTIEISPGQTAVDLFEILAHSGAPLVVETLAGLASVSLQPQPQNHAFATFAPLLDREDGRMDFAARTAHELYNRWRGFQPWPGAFTTLDGKKLIAHRMSPADATAFAPPAPAQRARFTSRIIASSPRALKIPGSSSSKFNWKARSASRPLNSCAELLSNKARASGIGFSDSPPRGRALTQGRSERSQDPHLRSAQSSLRRAARRGARPVALRRSAARQGRQCPFFG